MKTSHRIHERLAEESAIPKKPKHAELRTKIGRRLRSIRKHGEEHDEFKDIPGAEVFTNKARSDYLAKKAEEETGDSEVHDKVQNLFKKARKTGKYKFGLRKVSFGPEGFKVS